MQRLCVEQKHNETDYLPKKDSRKNSINLSHLINSFIQSFDYSISQLDKTLINIQETIYRCKVSFTDYITHEFTCLANQATYTESERDIYNANSLKSLRDYYQNYIRSAAGSSNLCSKC